MTEMYHRRSDIILLSPRSQRACEFLDYENDDKTRGNDDLYMYAKSQ
jgi:hypothetical protein